MIIMKKTLLWSYSEFLTPLQSSENLWFSDSKGNIILLIRLNSLNIRSEILKRFLIWLLNFVKKK